MKRLLIYGAGSILSLWDIQCRFHFVPVKEKVMFENAISIPNIFTIKNILIYLLIINLIGFFLMWSDKRKAKKGKWRIPEQTLFIVTALGSGKSFMKN